MRMDWANFADDDEFVPQKTRTVLTPGFHWGEIVQVNEQPGWRVTEQNPSGDCLSIWIDCEQSGDRKRVFVTVASNWTRKIIEIAECAGVTGPKRGEESWDEQSLVGAKVFIETGTYVVQQGKNVGEERAKVVQWVKPDRHPRGTETATERRARHDPNEVTRHPRRSTAAKAAAKERRESDGSDDIPF